MGANSQHHRQSLRRAGARQICRPILAVLEDRTVPTTLSIPTGLVAMPGGTITVPVNIDNPDPPGSGGITGAALAINYDPNFFTVSNSDVQLGTVSSGWAMFPNVVQTSSLGQIAVSLSSPLASTSTLPGSLALITFHVNNNAAGSSVIKLATPTNPAASPCRRAWILLPTRCLCRRRR